MADYTLLLAELVQAVQKITSAAPDMTAQEILDALAGNAGAGSGLDADLLDGHEAADFALTGDVPPAETGSSILTKLKTVDGPGSGLDADLLDGIQGGEYLPRAEAYQNFYSAPSQVLTDLKGIDGAGSGLDADLLDGQQASDFAAAGHTHSGLITLLALPGTSSYWAWSHGSFAVGSYTVDTSSFTNTPAITAGIKAWLVSVSAKWSVINNNYYLKFYHPSDSNKLAILVVRGNGNNITETINGIVPADANGDLKLSISGTAATSVTIRLIGYLR